MKKYLHKKTYNTRKIERYTIIYLSLIHEK